MQPMSLRHNLEIMSDTLDADAKPKRRPKKRSKSTSASSSSEDEKRKKSKKRKRSTSSSSSMSEDEKQKRRAKKKAKKLKKKMKKKMKKEKKAKTKEEGDAAVDVPISLMSKSMAPMTKEEWEKQQSVVRRVYDETTGRHRLIKGDGEVIEEIVSRERHKAINEQATRGDGQHFQATLLKDMSRK